MGWTGFGQCGTHAGIVNRTRSAVSSGTCRLVSLQCPKRVEKLHSRRPESDAKPTTTDTPATRAGRQALMRQVRGLRPSLVSDLSITLAEIRRGAVRERRRESVRVWNEVPACVPWGDRSVLPLTTTCPPDEAKVASVGV